MKIQKLGEDEETLLASKGLRCSQNKLNYCFSSHSYREDRDIATIITYNSAIGCCEKAGQAGACLCQELTRSH